MAKKSRTFNETGKSKTKVDELSEQYDIIKKLNISENERAEKLKKITDELEKQQKLLIESSEAYEANLISIGKSLGKNTEYYKESKKIIESTKTDIEGTLRLSALQVKNNVKMRASALKAASAYKNTTIQIVAGLDAVVQSKDANFDVEDSLERQAELHKDVNKNIDKRTKSGKALANVYDLQYQRIKQTAKAAKEAAVDIKKMHKGANVISSTSAGGVINKMLDFSKTYLGGKHGSIDDIAKNVMQKRAASAIKTAEPVAAAGTKANPVIGAGGKKLYGAAAQRALASGTGRATLTESAAVGGGGGGGAMAGLLRVAGPLAAAGAVIYAAANALNNGAFIKYTMSADILAGKSQEEIRKNARFQVEQTKEYRELVVEYNYILPLKMGRQYRMQMLEFSQSLLKDQYEFERGLIKDSVNFEVQKMKEVFEANLNQRKEAASLGITMNQRGFTISAKNLESMGISLTEMVDLSAKMAGKFGISGKEADKIAQTASVIKNRLGLSAEEVVDLTSVFRIMSGESAEESIKYIYGLEKFAKEAGVDTRALSKDLAEAGKEQFKYSNLTVQAFAKQAALLNTMGTSMVAMQKATDTIVGNYKDSIKAEMSLSAMIGKRVNLSGVRSRLLTGDTTGAASMLQTQLRGMNVENMNYFAKQQLMQATGLDMNSLMDLARGKELGSTAAELKKADAMKQGEAIAAGMRKIELENRAQTLKFEQAERYAMLMMEQSFRLQSIKQEFKLRFELEKAQNEQEREALYDKYEKEARSAQLMQIASANASTAIQDLEAQLSDKNLSAVRRAELEKQRANLDALPQKLVQAFDAGAIKMQDWPTIIPKLIQLGLEGKLYDAKAGTVNLDNDKYLKYILSKSTKDQLSLQEQSNRIETNALGGLRWLAKNKMSGNLYRTQDTEKMVSIRKSLMDYNPELLNEFDKLQIGTKEYNQYIKNLSDRINTLKGTSSGQITAVNNNTKALKTSTKVVSSGTTVSKTEVGVSKKTAENKPQPVTLIQDLTTANTATLQQEQVALMRLMVEALFDIEDNTGGMTDLGISIDGKRIDKALKAVRDTKYSTGKSVVY